MTKSKVISICEVYISTSIKKLENVDSIEEASERLIFAVNLAAKRHSNEFAKKLFEKYKLYDYGFSLA